MTDSTPSKELAELIVASLTPDSLKRMAAELFTAAFEAEDAGLRDLAEDWAEVADVEADREQLAGLRAAHDRASRVLPPPSPEPFFVQLNEGETLAGCMKAEAVAEALKAGRQVTVIVPTRPRPDPDPVDP